MTGKDKGVGVGDRTVESERLAGVATDDHERHARAWRLGDPLAMAVALALIGVSAYVGHGMKQRGLPIVLPSPPLLAFWHPHLGWGTPLCVLCVLVGLRLQRVAAELAWRRLLLAGWMLSVAWLCSLTLVDGLRNGWIDVLLDPNEYLHEVPRITNPAAFVASFTHFIAFGEGVDGTNVWTTHVAGHPPLTTLIFWLLARIGLGGGFWAGALCVLVASAASVAIPVTVRELGASSAARRAVPFVALFPGAVWMAVSADGLFAGVATSGLALVCAGAIRGRLLASLVGGLLLGTALFLSYGLVLFGLVVLTAVALSVRQRGLRPTVGPWLVACLGVAAVAAIHLAYGFNWVTGLTQLRIRYYQGIASQRPFSYFAYANLAAWLISCSPLLAIAISRSIGVLARGRGPWTEDRVVALMALSGVLAALLADLSAMSKAETERIWLTFGVIGCSGLALLRGRWASWALAGGAGWAILVNHLFNTGW
jgi:multisubunit Na+/H+ antiporter MnhF subunit